MSRLWLALVFASELMAWTAIGFGAFHLAGEGWRGTLVAAGAVALSIGAWGLLAAPTSSAPPPVALGTKVIVFGAAVALLFAAGHPNWSVALLLLIGGSHLGVHLAYRRGTGIPG